MKSFYFRIPILFAVLLLIAVPAVGGKAGALLQDDEAAVTVAAPPDGAHRRNLQQRDALGVLPFQTGRRLESAVKEPLQEIDPTAVAASRVPVGRAALFDFPAAEVRL